MRGTVVAVGSLSLLLSSCGRSDLPSSVAEETGTNTSVANRIAADELVKLPNYTEREGDTYLYTTAVSEEEEKKGQAVGSAIIYRYRGKKDGMHVLENVGSDGRASITYTCSEPCRIIRSRIGDTVDRIPFDPQSVIGSAFEDAIAGRLKPVDASEPAVAQTAPETTARPVTIPGVFLGEWNSSIEDCGTDQNDSRLRIERQKIHFYESEGPVSDVTIHNPRVVTVRAALSGEGETWTDTFKMAVSASGNELIIGGSTRYRCP